MNFPHEVVGRGGRWAVGSWAHPIPRGVARRDVALTKRSVVGIKGMKPIINA